MTSTVPRSIPDWCFSMVRPPLRQRRCGGRFLSEDGIWFREIGIEDSAVNGAIEQLPIGR